MATDIILDEGSKGEWVVVEGSVLRARTADLMLDSPGRRSERGGPHRRALVHDHGDGLTINYNGDYPGGVTINGARIRLRVQQSTAGLKLPKKGTVGELLLLRNSQSIRTEEGRVPLGDSFSLWLCLGPGTSSQVVLGAAVSWQRIPLAEVVRGTE